MKSRTYEPPLTIEGEEYRMDDLKEIYPGVIGFAIQHKELIYIPDIHGNGEGKVSEMIDNLSPRCRIVNVVSALLQSMLQRHGWKPEFKETEGGDVDVWSYRGDGK